MPTARLNHANAIVGSVLMHALVLLACAWWGDGARQAPPRAEEQVVMLDLTPPPPPPVPEVAPQPPPPPDTFVPPEPMPAPAAEPEPLPARAYKEAPPAPTAEEWALASTYTLKNSKRYRHTWGQQVRSLMGTAFEGPDQGVVRFLVEIAPDGRLVRLETLWKTSDEAERLARLAIQAMPPLPPTPNGQPLIFEKTISFQPFDAEVPPIYKDDCLPDPPRHRNRFAWDGASPPTEAPLPVAAAPLDPQALAECLKQLPQDSMDAEIGNDERQWRQWGSGQLGR